MIITNKKQFINNKYNLINILLMVVFLVIGVITAYLAINYPSVLFIFVGALLSVWLAYFYPSATLVLLITFGQIIQFELASIIQDYNSFAISVLNLRYSDPIILGIIITLLIKSLNRDIAVKKIIAGKGKFLTLFLMYVFIEMIRNLGQYGSFVFGEFRTYYQGFLIILYIAVSTKLHEEREKLFKVILILAISQILIALIKGAFIQSFSLNAYEKWLSAFGSIGLLYGLFAFYLYTKYEKIKIPAILKALIFTLGLVVLIIASNRSVWLAGVIGFIALIVLKEIKLRNQIAVILLILIVFSITTKIFTSEGYNFSNFFYTRLEAFTDYQRDPSSVWRYYIWSSIIESIAKEPMFGYGLGGNFGIFVSAINTVLGNSPHNFYLAMLYALGATGIILFFLFLFMYIKNLVKIKMLDSTDYIIKTNSFVVTACMLTYWIAYSTEKDFFTWCFLGLGFSIIINKKIIALQA